MSEITRDTFKWKLKDKEFGINEMNAPFKITALIHCSKLMNDFHRKHESISNKINRKKENIEKEKIELNKKIRSFNEKKEIEVKRIKNLDQKKSYFKEKTNYFLSMFEVLENSLLEDHGLKVPDNIRDLRAFKRMLEDGIIQEKEVV